VSLALAETGALALLRDAMATLSAAGLADARDSAEWLLAEVIGLGRFGVYLDPPRELSALQVERYRRLVDRRAAREPLQQVLGYEDFCGLRIAVTPDVLIPRPETEGLVQWAIERLRARPAPRVVDVGTGSGAIACALAAQLPRARVLALDWSIAALAVARQNVQAHGLGRRVQLVAGDLLRPLRRADLAVDAIVANLPYLPSAMIAALPPEISRCEPRLALDGGPDGSILLRRLVAEAPAALGRGGWLLMEVGDDQAHALVPLMRSEGFDDVESRPDLNGVERYVGGRSRHPGSHPSSRSTR
jgi:release factor glutamine methyltransferase